MEDWRSGSDTFPQSAISHLLSSPPQADRCKTPLTIGDSLPKSLVPEITSTRSPPNGHDQFWRRRRRSRHP